MKRSTKQIFWIVVYFVLITAPLLILLLAPRPAGRTFWRELSVGLGFAGLSLMGLQFIPTARLPFLSDVFPSDTLYAFHHRLSIAAFLLTLAHPLVLFVQNPYTLQLLNVFTAPARAVAGVTAVLALIPLVVTSVRRVELGMSYESWRLFHDILSVAVIGLAFYHILNVDYYTSVPLQRGLLIGLGAVWALMIIYIRVIKPWMLLQRSYQVAEVIEERGDTWSLVLEPVGHEGLTFRAGQFAWLSIGHSPFRIEEHPFSFASSAENPEQLGFAIKELGDFTSTIGDVASGTPVYVDGPYGSFDLYDERDAGLILIAGGIGSAPIISMLRTLADRGDDRQIQFFYGNPTWETVIFREELETLKERLNLEVIHVLESPPEGWEGESGFIDTDVLERLLCEDFRECAFFICGPLPMIDAVTNALEKLAVSRGRMRAEVRARTHSERFKMA
jgi:predicted ferric reductase